MNLRKRLELLGAPDLLVEETESTFSVTVPVLQVESSDTPS